MLEKQRQYDKRKFKNNIKLLINIRGLQKKIVLSRKFTYVKYLLDG